MSGYPFDLPQAEPPEPKDSALGVLFRRGDDGRYRVLLGRRARKARFMPGHLAFPGGRLDTEDEPGRPGAFARCATRELAEEIGIRIDPDRWTDIGERVTPPMFPVRFRTRFFAAELPDGATLPETPPIPEEIDRVLLAAAGELLEQWRRGEALVPPPCLLLLREIAACDDRPFAELARRLGETNARESRLPRVEFVPDVWVLPVKTRTVPPATHTNVWMPGVGRFAIVDPGSGDPGEIERVLAMAERRIALGATPDSVVLTHGHPDHTPGALPLAETLGVPLRAHPNVLQRVLDGTAQATRSPETRALNEGDTVDLDGMTLRALHTPGHDPGHLVFALPERDALIAGDLVSGLSTILVLPPEGDMEAFLASLRRVESVAPRMLLPAHGPPLPGKAISRVIRHREEREARVRAALGPDARDVADIARDAYTDTPGAPRVLAEGQTLAHLLHLERRGLASRSRGTPGPWRGSTG